MNIHDFMQSRWRKYGLIFVIWTLVVIVEAAQYYASQFVEHHTFPLWLAIRRACEEWYPWAFLTVGILWMALSKPHVGIHGTNQPETIGRAASHGCIRTANWDAARVKELVTVGNIVSIF